jgi:hypothetical protein
MRISQRLCRNLLGMEGFLRPGELSIGRAADDHPRIRTASVPGSAVDWTPASPPAKPLTVDKGEATGERRT